jgi:ribosomal protein S18 acetylase RimI-like enzyme
MAAVDASRVALRRATGHDHAFVIRRLDDWWGGRQMAAMLPKLFFVHFPATTTVAVERLPAGGERIVGFLCGFVSQADPLVAYIHFVGVDPEARGAGLGRSLYTWFFERAASLGCRRVECVTSPINTGSRAFHAAMGFDERLVDDYDGHGEARVLMSRPLS